MRRSRSRRGAMRWAAVVAVIAACALIYLAVDYFAFDTGAWNSGRRASPRLGAGERVVVEGVLQFERPADFNVATDWEAVAPLAYIPPCDPGFDLCVYYAGDRYEGTTFESAGLRVQRRPDLGDSEACLYTPPAGYISMRPAAVRESGAFATAVFEPLGDAAMGHYAEGALYRLFFGGTVCYEFETRIGRSQFANYEPGTIEEFTDEEREALEERFRAILAAVRFVERPGEPLFPARD